MKQRFIAISAAIFLTLTHFLGNVTDQLAQADSYTLDWYTTDSGGSLDLSGGTFTLSATIGQPDAGAPLSGATFSLDGGFWPVVLADCACAGDLNGDGRRDGSDIQPFVACFLTVANCSCADVDGAGGITSDDVSAFVTALLTTSTCP